MKILKKFNENWIDDSSSINYRRTFKLNQDSIEDVISKYSNKYPELANFLNEFIEKFSNRVEYEEKLQEYEDEYKDDPDEGVPEVYLLETEIETEMPVNISEIWPDFFSDLCNSNW